MPAIELEGGFNARDVGGVRTAGGGVVREGRLLRSETPQLFTDADVERLLGRGVSLVVDLRNPVHDQGDSGALGRRVRRVLLDYAGLLSGRMLEAHFALDQWLPAQASLAGPVVVAFAELLVGNPGATLVHCHTGKDRTGVVVGMTLWLVGVSRDDIIADYALTAAAHQPMVTAFKANGMWRVQPPPFAAGPPHPESFAAMLGLVEERWPTPQAYLAAHGADPTLADRLRTHLVG
jgi:hypothetical protein